MEKVKLHAWRDCAAFAILGGAGLLAASPPALGAEPAATPRAGVRLALASDGRVGAWLAVGPFDRTHTPDEENLYPRLGDTVGSDPGAPRWHLASGNDGTVDITSGLDPHGFGTFYAGAILRLGRGGRHTLLLGYGDGLVVFVDGRRAYARPDPIGDKDDEDLVSLDLAAGDHTVVVAAHRRYVMHPLRVRVLDDALEPPWGASWKLPGAADDDARTLAAQMSLVSLDRGMGTAAYQAVLTVRYAGGAPGDVPLDVHARLTRAASSDTAPPLFAVDAGNVPVGERGAGRLVVTLPRVTPEEVEDQDWSLHVDVAGRGLDLPFHPRRAVRAATTRAARAIADAQTLPLRPGSLESVEHLRARLVEFAAKGDGDLDAELADARELDELSGALEEQRDPYTGQTPRTWRTGVMRRAYRSPADGQLAEFALYVPPGFDAGRKYPLIVALHGMNGRPLEMIMWLFGHDDPQRDGNWEDRHPVRDLASLPAIVVAPDGHFNAMFREMGEDDVMRVIDWTMANYPIDPSRVTITGPSMGGIGTAACALHHPDRFAAAEPLCGYHSYFVRSDIGGKSMRPWETFVAEQRSNVFWAENGLYLPLYIVHGTKDLPEENSGVLIDRYAELNYDVTHEHPELGHNVWQSTYEDLKGARWLLGHQRPMHPRALRFKTAGTRWADDAWLHVRELAASDTWGEVTARIDANNAIAASTHGIAALALDRDTYRIDDGAPVVVGIDGHKVTFQAGEPIELHKEGAEWRAGPAIHDGPYKHGNVTGPVRDVFHEPILFVWGAADPAQARANEEVAREWARVRWGVKIDYPVMSDTEFYAQGMNLGNDRALFLVGNARSNRVVREFEPAFPIRIDGADLLVGERRIAGDGDLARSQLGAAFIRPNPRRTDRYVVVIEGVGPLGTWRSLSLPDLLPDYVVFDEELAPAGGQLILGAGKVRSAGFFANDWSLPDGGESSAIARSWGAVPAAKASRTN